MAEPGGLASELAHQWPSYAAYAVTFLVIGIMWVNHHELFDGIEVVTRSLHVPQHPAADGHRLPPVPDRR